METYTATFIINPSETKRDIPALTEWIKSVLAEMSVKVDSTQDLGLRDFAHAARKAYPNGHYLAFNFTAKGDINAEIQQRFRLEKEVKQVFVEKALAPA